MFYYIQACSSPDRYQGKPFLVECVHEPAKLILDQTVAPFDDLRWEMGSWLMD